MKRDQYIPHDVNMRTTNEVVGMIDKKGAAGYGFLWVLMEYLRVQENYIGDLRALKPLTKQMKTRPPKLEKILKGYGLFVCVENTFYSPKLNEVMKLLEDRRARIEAYKRNKEKENSLEISDETSEKSDIVSFEVKGKGKGEGKEDTSSPISSSSTAEAAEEKVLSKSFPPVMPSTISSFS